MAAATNDNGVSAYYLRSHITIAGCRLCKRLQGIESGKLSRYMDNSLGGLGYNPTKRGECLLLESDKALFCGENNAFVLFELLRYVALGVG